MWSASPPFSAVRHIAAGRACSSGSASMTKVFLSTYQTRLASSSAASSLGTQSKPHDGVKIVGRHSPAKQRQQKHKAGSSSIQDKAGPSNIRDKQPESRQKLSGSARPTGARRGGRVYKSQNVSPAFKLSSAHGEDQARSTPIHSTSEGIPSSDQDLSQMDCSTSMETEQAAKGAEGQTDPTPTPNGMSRGESESAAGPSGTSPSSNDELTTAEERLRAFFAAKTGRSSHTSFKAALAEASGNVSSSSTFPIDQGLQLESITLDDTARQPAASFAEATPSPTFSRPKFADLQRAGQDEFIGLYRSDTVWDPTKDYAIMPEGPERTGITAKVLDRAPVQHIMVILDGDNLLFAPRHMNKGYEGGKFVYNELRERIAKKHRLNPQNVDMRVRIFSATNALATVLSSARVMRKDFFFDFMQGIMDSGPYNYVVNTGKANQAADIRVKAALADAIRDPRCFRVYLGGLDDYGYKEDLSLIHERGLLASRVNLIQIPGFARDSNAYRAYAHQAIDLDYLFKSNRTALETARLYDEEAFKSEDAVAKAVSKIPCAFHHLTKVGCSFADACQYSHEPVTDEYKERLRKRYKQRKCPIVSRGEECHFGDDCLFSH